MSTDKHRDEQSLLEAWRAERQQKLEQNLETLKAAPQGSTILIVGGKFGGKTTLARNFAAQTHPKSHLHIFLTQATENEVFGAQTGARFAGNREGAPMLEATARQYDCIILDEVDTLPKEMISRLARTIDETPTTLVLTAESVDKFPPEILSRVTTRVDMPASWSAKPPAQLKM